MEQSRGMGRVTSLVLLSLAILHQCAGNACGVDLIGYLPYYRMGASYNANILPGQLAMLDEVRYFGLTVSASGEVSPLAGSGNMASHTSRIAAIKNAIDALPAGQRPRLNITLGGAGEAAGFAAVAANSTLRSTLAVNIDSLLDSSGATSVDTDWEHPANNELNNYGLLLQRIKQEVGSERRVYATVDPTKYVPQSTFSGANAIDGVSLMTYDLSWWANDQADTNRGEHSLPVYATDAVDAWTDAQGSQNRRPYVFGTWGKNAQETTLGIGLPFYGHVIGTSAAPQGGAAYTYSELVAGGGTTDGNYYTYAGQTVWLPGPDLVEQRVQFAHDRGLQNIIIWELGQDLPPSNANSLLRRAYEKNQSFLPILVPGDYDGDGNVGTSDYNLWQSTFGATSGGDLRADGNSDGTVDAADYTFWRDRLSSAPGNGSNVSQTVPEPLSLGLLLIAASGLFLFTPRHRS